MIAHATLELASKKALEKQDANTIRALAISMALVLVVAFTLSEQQCISPSMSASMIMLATALGALILGVKIEGWLRAYILHSDMVRFVGLAIFAIVVYVGRLKGLADVNKIFHLDPGALPLTMWVATITGMMTFLTPLVVGGLLVSAVLGMYYTKVKDHDREEQPWVWFAAAFSFGLLWFICELRLGEENRRQMLYRVAQESDFVSSFECEGVDSQGLVGLFIGPEQRRVLLAPAIQESYFLAPRTPSLFKPIKIPERFPTIECVAPKIDIRQWNAPVVLHNR